MPRNTRKSAANAAATKQESPPKLELEMDHLEEIKVEPLVPLEDPIDQNMDQARCQFCMKLFAESGGPAVTTRKTITYVLGIRKWVSHPEHPDCCQECKTMFDMFYEFKKSCLAAMARSKELLSEKNGTMDEEDCKMPLEEIIVPGNETAESLLPEKYDSDMDEKGFQDDHEDDDMEPLPEEPTEMDKKPVSPTSGDAFDKLTDSETVPKEPVTSSSILPPSSDDLSPSSKPRKRKNATPKAKKPKPSNDELSAGESAPEERNASLEQESTDGTRKRRKSKKEPKFACDRCPDKFTTEKQLTMHINRHLGIRTVPCRREGCGKKFFDTTHRHAHEIGCGKEVKIMCSVCAAIFRSMSALRTHMASHGELKFFCKVCGKGFYRKAKLDKHASVHSDARNYECNVCGKRFKSKEANRVHQRVHTEERPYVCHICNRGFRYNCGLKAHLERGHDASDLAPQKPGAGATSSEITTGGWF